MSHKLNLRANRIARGGGMSARVASTMAAILLGTIGCIEAAQGQQSGAQQLNPAPNAPKTVPEPTPQGGSNGQPANICQELVAFLQQRNANPPQAAGVPPAASQPSGHAGSAQAGARAEAGGDAAQRESGQVTSIPKGQTAARAPTLSLTQAQAHAAANDLGACQNAAREMRRAGVPMPDSLIALAALRRDLLQGR
jgi:hypothetical protein